MAEWVRIPAEIVHDPDRRGLTGILTAAGLEVRIVKVKFTKNGTYKRFVEYREQDDAYKENNDGNDC